MELIFILAKFLQYVFVAPVMWLSSGLAAMAFPYEGDKRHDALTLLIAFLISASLIGILVYLLSE